MADCINKALSVLCEPGSVYEIRVVKTGWNGKLTTSGYFDDFGMMEQECRRLSNSGVKAVYFTINPCKPDLMARACNRTQEGAVSTTCDGEILKRTRLLIDCDPVRPAGISSSDPQHVAAIERTRQIKDYLTGEGFPEPLFGDSGNGGHLVYGIDLPNDSESNDLVKGFLESLAKRFTDSAIDVDLTVFNAARISKVYGTMTRKGDNTPLNPHRLSKIIETPDRLQIVPVELLRKVGNVAPVASAPASEPDWLNDLVAPEMHKPREATKEPANAKTPEFVEAMLAKKGLMWRPPFKHGDAIIWKLNECPNAKEHSTEPDGACVTLQNGLVGFRCHHAHCVHLKAKDVFDNVNKRKAESTSSEPKEKPEQMFARLADQFIEEYKTANRRALYADGVNYFYQDNHYEVAREPEQFIRNFCHENDLGQSNYLASNLLKAVSNRCYNASAEMPFWNCSNPPIKRQNVIAYQNGLLDLDNIEKGLIPHTDTWCSTACLPFDYDPSATCPIWLNFLNQASCNDPEWIATLQEYIGYCLSSDVSLQKAMILTGQTRGGKGTILSVVENLIGNSCLGGFKLDQLASQFGLMSLIGKSVATVGEIELQGHPHMRRIIEILKSIIGADKQTIERKHIDALSVRLGVRFFMACNELPRLLDSSGAMATRLLILPFDESFAGRENTHLGEQLKSELSGIANWALAGLVRLRANLNKFTVCKRHLQAHQQFARETSTVLSWVLERLVVHKSVSNGRIEPENLTSEDVSVPVADAYNDFVAWLDENDISTKVEIDWFGKNLKVCLSKVIKKVRRGDDGKRAKIYAGIALKAKDCNELDAYSIVPSANAGGDAVTPVTTICIAPVSQNELNLSEVIHTYTEEIVVTGVTACPHKMTHQQIIDEFAACTDWEQFNCLRLKHCVGIEWRADMGKYWLRPNWQYVETPALRAVMETNQHVLKHCVTHKTLSA